MIIPIRHRISPTSNTVFPLDRTRLCMTRLSRLSFFPSHGSPFSAVPADFHKTCRKSFANPILGLIAARMIQSRFSSSSIQHSTQPFRHKSKVLVHQLCLPVVHQDCNLTSLRSSQAACVKPLPSVTLPGNVPQAPVYEKACPLLPGQTYPTADRQVLR